MARNIPERGNIIPGDIFYCPVCGQPNMFFVMAKNHSIVLGGALCHHVDKSLVGKKIKPAEAEHFLNTEKEEANERKENILEFISNINRALISIRPR